jgi:hypothetical protein
MGFPGRPSFDTASKEFLRVYTIAEHNEAAHKQLPRNCDYGLWRVTTFHDSIEETPKFLISFDRHLSRFGQQKPHHSRTRFADGADSLPVGRAVFDRIHADKGSHLSRIGESLDGLKRVNQRKRGEQSNAWMSLQQCDPFISLSLLSQPLLNSVGLRSQIVDQCYQFICLAGSGRRQVQLFEPCPTSLAVKSRAKRKPSSKRDRLKAILGHRPHLHQLVPIAHLAKDFLAVSRPAKQAWKASAYHQIENVVRIALVVFLLPPRKQTDFVRVTYPHLVPDLREHRLEPLAITARFEPDDHFPGELQVKLAHTLLARVLQVVVKSKPLYFSVFGCQITYGLLSCVKVDSDVNWHSVPPSDLKDQNAN